MTPDLPASQPSIVVRDLTVAYGPRLAINNVSFTVGKGITALIGPNGAGKTSLMNATMGQTSFQGSIEVVAGGRANISVRKGGRGRENMGYLPQKFDLSGGLRAWETVAYAAWCSGSPRRACASQADAALARVGLSDRRCDRVRTLSGGQRQRLGVACAIAHHPAILLLDEPTVGLDPAQRMKLRQYLRDISETTSILLATHLLEDVKAVADSAIVLTEGAVAFEGSLEELEAIGADRGASETALDRAYSVLVPASDHE